MREYKHSIKQVGKKGVCTPRGTPPPCALIVQSTIVVPAVPTIISPVSYCSCAGRYGTVRPNQTILSNYYYRLSTMMI